MKAFLLSVVLTITTLFGGTVLAAEADLPTAVSALQAAPAAEEGKEPSGFFSLNGGVEVLSRYALSDAAVPTNEPVVQAWAAIGLGEHCSFDLWGSKGFATHRGDELDVGASCRTNITDEIEIGLGMSRYILQGTSDMTAIVGSASWQALDLEVSYYVTDHGENAFKVELGYTISVIEKLDVRGLIVYETGFDSADIVVGGVEASYALSDSWSLKATVYVPIISGPAQFVGGASYKFR